VSNTKEQDEVARVRGKVPRWFKKPELICSRILSSFMRLQQQHNVVTYNMLETECADIRTFRENYNQMKIISKKNHAKVFHEENDRLYLWEPVRDFILCRGSGFHNLILVIHPQFNNFYFFGENRRLITAS